MNDLRRFDSLDAIIYASMKYVGDMELEEYNNADIGLVFSEQEKICLLKRLIGEKYRGFFEKS